MFPTSTVGRKLVMAITGQALIFFVLFHIAGNSTIFFHKLNAYVVALHNFPLIVWGGRAMLAAVFLVHIWYGTVLKFENDAAKPEAYAVTQYRNATFAGRYQFWSGAVIAGFLAYHLLQFTLRVTDPSLSADTHMDSLNRPDVFMMIAGSFQNIGMSGFYILALTALCLHLMHGIQSSFQTWGLTNDTTLPLIERAGTVVAIVLFCWYAAIPITILMGLLKG